MKTTKPLVAAIFSMNGVQSAVEVNEQQRFGRVLGGGAEWLREVSRNLAEHRAQQR